MMIIVGLWARSTGPHVRLRRRGSASREPAGVTYWRSAYPNKEAKHAYR